MALRKMNPTDAYEEVYDVHDRKAASKRASDLLKKDHINERIAFLSEIDVREEISCIQIERDWIERELLANYVEANAAGDRNNAIKILQLLGTDVGMFVQRKEVLSGKLDVMKEASDVIKQQIAARLQLLFPGLDVSRFIGEATASAAMEHAGEAEVEPQQDLPAIPETVGLPPGGSDEAEAVSDGRESGGQDLLRGNGSVIPSDG
jgi:hypothetical protein